MKNRISNTFLTASAILVSASAAVAAEARWRRVTPEGARFSVEVPGERQADDQPGQYSYTSAEWFYCIKLLPTNPGSRMLLERDDRKALEARLALTRDTLVATVNATSGHASYGDLDGYPSLRFPLEIGDLAGTNLLVLTSEHTYMVMTLGPRGARADDAKRFLDGFRLTTNVADRPTLSSLENGDLQ